MTEIERLKMGLERIEKGWCQWTLAMGRDGLACDVDAPEAIAWCARGSMMLTDDRPWSGNGDSEWEKSEQALQLIADTLGIGPEFEVINLNNRKDTTKKMMVDAFKRTIERVESES